MTGDIFRFKTACASDTLAIGLTLLGVVIISQMKDPVLGLTPAA